jgi:uncharacterized protein YicC (UPF0701 family)
MDPQNTLSRIGTNKSTSFKVRNEVAELKEEIEELKEQLKNNEIPPSDLEFAN